MSKEYAESLEKSNRCRALDVYKDYYSKNIGAKLDCKYEEATQSLVEICKTNHNQQWWVMYYCMQDWPNAIDCLKSLSLGPIISC